MAEQETDKTHFSYYLVNSSNYNMNGDYSSTATDFTHNFSGQALIKKITVFIEDNGVFTADTYGAVSALTNGVKFFIYDGSSKTYIHDQAIKSNYQYELEASNVKYELSVGTNDFMTVNFVQDDISNQLWIQDDTYQFGIELNDDLSGLVKHYCVISGYFY